MKLKIIAFIATLALVMLPGIAQAAFNPFSNICNDKNNQGSPTCQQNNAQQDKPTNPVITKITEAVTIISLLAGTAAVIVIMAGGLAFATAGGEPNKIKSARSSITSGLIGLAVIAFAWTIIMFITTKIIQ